MTTVVFVCIIIVMEEEAVNLRIRSISRLGGWVVDRLNTLVIAVTLLVGVSRTSSSGEGRSLFHVNVGWGTL